MLRMVEYMSSQAADHLPNSPRLSQLLKQVASELTYEIGTAANGVAGGTAAETDT
jgi:hypothetical protein